ncbi:MAG: hypothetical protein AB7V46_23305 [Thermomicrobiales bacterium]
MTAQTVVATHFDFGFAALDNTASVETQTAVAEVPVRVFAVDAGPPRARLNLLQRFLI